MLRMPIHNPTLAEVAKITIDQSQAPTGDVGNVGQIASWLANRVKAITGKADWYDEPDLTLAELARITIDQSQMPSGNVGNIWQIISWLANRINAITGKANWYDTPDFNLAQIWHTFTDLIVFQSDVPTGNRGNIWQMVSWFGNRIKAITGCANWYDDPPTTLAALLAMAGSLSFGGLVWSTGVDGDLTVAADTPFPREVMFYRNLTVQSGKRFYAPSSRLYVICVSDTLQLDGIIEHRMGAAGGTNLGNLGCNGGRGAGTLIVLARRIQGSGTLSVAGSNGSTPTTHGGIAGATGVSPAGANGSIWGGLTPTGGGAGPRNSSTGGSGGSAASATAWRDLLLMWWRWKFQLYTDGEYVAGGGAGANAPSDTSAFGAVYAPGGGGGGSFVASGGSGGAVNMSATSAAGGGGGGAGGVLLVASKEAVPAITITAAGGDGGNAYYTGNGGAGGGGGGAGGLILLCCPSHSATLIATGGQGGVAAGNASNGSPGGDGKALVALT